MFRGIHSIMMYVPNVVEAARWYARLLQTNPVYVRPDFPVLTVGDVELCFHVADEKGAPFVGGAVTYWRVDDFYKTRLRAEIFGAKLHRGPLAIDGGQQIAQFRDPFGNLFGVIAPAEVPANAGGPAPGKT